MHQYDLEPVPRERMPDGFAKIRRFRQRLPPLHRRGRLHHDPLNRLFSRDVTFLVLILPIIASQAIAKFQSRLIDVTLFRHFDSSDPPLSRDPIARIGHLRHPSADSTTSDDPMRLLSVTFSSRYHRYRTRVPHFLALCNRRSHPKTKLQHRVLRFVHYVQQSQDAAVLPQRLHPHWPDLGRRWSAEVKSPQHPHSVHPFGSACRIVKGYALSVTRLDIRCASSIPPCRPVLRPTNVSSHCHRLHLFKKYSSSIRP